MAITARLATQNDPKVQTIESGHDQKKRLRVLTSYYGTIVPLAHIGGYPRRGGIVLAMPAPESGHDCNAMITSIAARIGYDG